MMVFCSFVFLSRNHCVEWRATLFFVLVELKISMARLFVGYIGGPHKFNVAKYLCFLWSGNFFFYKIKTVI